jgi:hypothetical protein
MATDEYAYWRAALAGQRPLANPDNPQPGYYRRARREGPDDAVAYFTRNGRMACAVNGFLVDDGAELWQWVCDQPVVHKDYLYRIEKLRWPNENVVVLGHNRPPADSSVEAIQSVLDALKVEAKRILAGGVAKDQDQADQAADVANELLEVEKKAIAAHRAEKAPFMAETKRIDKKWFTLRDLACDLKEAIRFRVITPYLRARKEAAESGELHEGTRIAAGSIKRTTALRTVVSGKINDYQAALSYFADAAEIRETLQRLVDRAVRGGSVPPGCERIEEERAV